LTKFVNHAGIYQVKLHIRGRPWIVTVDDEFLYLEELDNLRYAYVVPGIDNIWAAILEKAVAKIKGNYDNLNNGRAENMLRMLTGAPVMSYDVYGANVDVL
jgi:hypothetical protein